MNNKILIFTGGTGGHVIPAVNFANYLLSKGYDCSLITDIRGKKYIKDFNGKVYSIRSAHLSGNFFIKFKSLMNLFIGFCQSFILLLKLKPKKCISFGSYATFMPLLSFVIINNFRAIDMFLHEQNSVLGKVNSFFLPYAKIVFTNFIFIQNLNPKYSKKLKNVGLPYNIKLNFKTIQKKNINKKKIIFIYGGSQGSTPLIKHMILILKKIDSKSFEKIKIIVQTPKKIKDILKQTLLNLKIEFEIKEFFNDIHKILAITDLAVTRAGAGTINDLISYKIPSILIPLPHSVNNHQLYNAKYLSDKKAAIIIDENDFNIDNNTNIFKRLIASDKETKNMIIQLKKINIHDSNKLIFLNIFYENQ